jgi:hypothetical protein
MTENCLILKFWSVKFSLSLKSTIGSYSSGDGKD